MVFAPAATPEVATPVRAGRALPSRPSAEQAPPAEPPPGSRLRPAIPPARGGTPSRRSRSHPPSGSGNHSRWSRRRSYRTEAKGGARCTEPLATRRRAPAARRWRRRAVRAASDTRPSASLSATPAAASSRRCCRPIRWRAWSWTARLSTRRMARRRGQQGRVALQVNVSAEGMPVTVSVAQSSGYASLDAAALRRRCSNGGSCRPPAADCRCRRLPSAGPLSADR